MDERRKAIGEKIGVRHAGTDALRARLATIERKMTRPSAEPSGDSTARSGWGIKPTTLRSRLKIPVIALWRAFWICLAIVFIGTVPVGCDVTKNNLVVAFEFGECGGLTKIISVIM